MKRILQQRAGSRGAHFGGEGEGRAHRNLPTTFWPSFPRKRCVSRGERAGGWRARQSGRGDIGGGGGGSDLSSKQPLGTLRDPCYLWLQAIGSGAVRAGSRGPRTRRSITTACSSFSSCPLCVQTHTNTREVTTACHGENVPRRRRKGNSGQKGARKRAGSTRLMTRGLHLPRYLAVVFLPFANPPETIAHEHRPPPASRRHMHTTLLHPLQLWRTREGCVPRRAAHRYRDGAVPAFVLPQFSMPRLFWASTTAHYKELDLPPCDTRSYPQIIRHQQSSRLRPPQPPALLADPHPRPRPPHPSSKPGPADQLPP